MANITLQDKKIDNLIRQKVIEAIQNVFNDPDYGLPLRPEFVRRLKKSIKSKKAGRTIPFENILKKHSE